MRNREVALAAVRDRLTHAATNEDLSTILSEKALGDAEELAALTDPAADLDAAYALGMFHWFRYLALPDDASHDDLDDAARLLAPIFRADPEAIPEPLRRFYQDPGALTGRAIDLVTAYQRSGELSLLTEAVALFRDVIAATPADYPHRAAYLSNLGAALQKLSERTGDTALMGEAVQVCRDAVAAAPVGHPDRAVRLTNLGNALWPLFEYTGDTALLAEAVQVGRDTVAAISADHPDRAAYLTNLGTALQTLSERTGDTALLTEAVQVRRDAVAAPAGRLDRAIVLSDLGSALQRLYERTGDASLLAEAVQVRRDAVAATPAGHPDRAGYLNNLSIALQRLYERTGDTALLAEAVQTSRDAATATSVGHPYRAAVLSNLGAALQHLSERTGDTALLEEAVQAIRDGLADISADQPEIAGPRNSLGLALRALYERTGDAALLAEAVQTSRDAVTAAPAGHHDRAGYLNNLGIALQRLYERTGDTALLPEAVQTSRDAVAATPADHPDRPSVLSNLGAALQRLSARTGDTALLPEAVQTSRDAVAATPADRPDRAMYLTNLGSALQELYERTGDTAPLAEAVQASRDAVAATPADHPDRAMYLNNVGSALQELYERTGDTALLAEAVQASRDAVAATPADHPDRAMYLNNLGSALQELYERTGDTALLAEAVQADRDAVAATPKGHPDIARNMSSLGIGLHRLSERTGQTALLEEAVQADRDALAATPADHPSRAIYLSNLGIALQAFSEQAEQTGQTALLEEAVQASRVAVAATPAGHPDHAKYLSNLGAALQRQSGQTEETALLAEAVQASRDAVAATPADHPDIAGRLTNLGIALQVLSGHTGDTLALAEAGQCFTQAAESSGARASVRITAYRAVAELSDQAVGSPGDALAAVEAAVGLLPQVAPRLLVRSDREYSLGRLASLAGRAAAAAVAAGRPDRAVELLEQTRGVLVAETLDARSSDLSRLRSHPSGLADEFDELRSRIDALDHTDAFVPQRALTAGGDPTLARARQDAYAAWDGLIARIRAIDGFEKFLQPPGIHQLARQARRGPVVFIYSSPPRCDALILTDEPGTPVRLVSLVDLTEEDAYRQANRLVHAQRAAAAPGTSTGVRIAAQAEILDVLAWMWDSITGPVLTALGYTATPADGRPWPHLWWCPVGILAYLPLHAAGHHHDLAGDSAGGAAHPRTMLDRVVSSYTTTVRGLAYARAQNLAQATTTTLVIAVPYAPDAPPLPGVTAEASAIAELIPGAHVLPHPTRDTVLAVLPGYPVAHFACHGYTDWANPAASQLILHDYQISPLTVADISACHLNGGLAFLSACNTTVTSLALADEAVHITGAFHLAGYQHVIGTLWPVNDTIASELVRHFYTDLTHHGITAADPSRAAHALHWATRRLREKYLANPSLWAAHTHTGP